MDNEHEEGRTPLPRGEGAEIAQSQILDGHIGLEYTEQNFNALVAANTAMQTELSARDEKIGLIEQQRDSFKEGLDDARSTTIGYRTQIKDLQHAASETASRVLGLDAEVSYQRERAEELQRKLDRSAGYLDRVIDEQQMHADRDGAPVMPSEIGPDLGSIPRAWRRPTDGRVSMMAGEAMVHSAEYPRRRY